MAGCLGGAVITGTVIAVVLSPTHTTVDDGICDPRPGTVFLDCKRPVGAIETATLGAFPPDDEDAGKFVDARGFPSECVGYSPLGMPPCAGMCTTFQGAVSYLYELCERHAMPEPLTDSFWELFQDWYESQIVDVPCKDAAKFIIVFSATQTLMRSNVGVAVAPDRNLSKVITPWRALA